MNGKESKINAWFWYARGVTVLYIVFFIAGLFLRK
jgi:hypothetical protein